MRAPTSLRRLCALAAVATTLAACGTTATPRASPPAEPQASPPTATEPPASQSEGITVSHAQGETVVPVAPETVLTFDLGALDTLDALGVDVAGVPDVATLPDRLRKYATDEYVKAGTLFEPDYEQVNALDPDLIIVAGRSSAAYPQLSALAPTVDLTVDNGDFIDSFTGHLQTLGEIFGRQEQVAEAVTGLHDRIAEVSALAQDAGSGLIVLTTGGEVSAYGPGSRFGLIHDVLGVQPAAEDLNPATHGDAVSFEFILETNPDHLFVIDRDATIGESGQAAHAVLDNEIVRQTTAWQQGNVTYLDGVNWYLLPTGLGSVRAMIDEVEAALA